MQNSNPLPRYVQVSEFLIREIAAGRLQDGQRLAPEREMARELQISVGTLRKSLAILEEKKLLERIQGSGNYIRQQADAPSVYGMFRLELPEGGGLPRADILSVDVMAKPADLPPFGTADQGTRIRRLRFLNDVTIAVEEIWLDADAGVLERESITDSLYHSYRTRLGLWISRAEDRVGLGKVPAWAPAAFGCASGAAAGYIERFSWSDDSKPVEFSRTWFDPDKALYVQRLK